MKVTFSNGFSVECDSVGEIAIDSSKPSMYSQNEMKSEDYPTDSQHVLNLTITENMDLALLKEKITDSTVNIIEVENNNKIIVYEGFNYVPRILRNITSDDIAISISIKCKNISDTVNASIKDKE